MLDLSPVLLPALAGPDTIPTETVAGPNTMPTETAENLADSSLSLDNNNVKLKIQDVRKKHVGCSNPWNSHRRTWGSGFRSCRVCGNHHGVIRKYGLMCCRQCFRSNAKEIGFIKYR